MHCKKLLTVILCIILALSLTACKKDTIKKKNSPLLNNKELENVEHSGEKFEGEISSTTGFSDDVALVTEKDDPNTLYCINKNGYIIFKTEIDGNCYTALNFGKFRDGITVTDHNTVITKKGDVITAEKLGCDVLYRSSLMYGCVLAEKTNADGIKLLGVLDTSLKWIVEPSAMYYSEFTDYLPLFASTDSFYHGSKDGYVYIFETNCWFDIKNGTIVTELPSESTSDLWQLNPANNVYYDRNGKISLRLGIYNEIIQTYNFNNGICVLRFKDKDGTEKMVAINEKGDEFFEPVAFDSSTADYWNCYFDAENIVFISKNMITVYDYSGNITSTMDVSATNTAEIYYTNGIITMQYTADGSDTSLYKFLNSELTPLF